MLGQNSQISDLESIMLRNDLFKKFKLSRLGIFGSTARGEESNDIDILIEDNVDYRSRAGASQCGLCAFPGDGTDLGVKGVIPQTTQGVLPYCSTMKSIKYRLAMGKTFLFLKAREMVRTIGGDSSKVAI